MREVRLTPKQQKFLDDYIRRKGQKKADKKYKPTAIQQFLQFKGDVLDELDILPAAGLDEFRQQAQARIAEADAQAEKGKFVDAAKILRAAKEELIKLAARIDFQPVIDDLQMRIADFVQTAAPYAKRLHDFETWRIGTYETNLRNVRQQLREGNDPQPPAAEAAQAPWLAVQMQVLAAKAAQVDELAATTELWQNNLLAVANRVEELFAPLPGLRARVDDLRRMCQRQPAALEATNALDRQLRADPQVGALRDATGAYVRRTNIEERGARLAATISDLRQQLAEERQELRRKVAVKFGEGQAPQWLRDELAAAAAADRRLQGDVREAPHRGRPRKPRFDMAALVRERLTVSPAELKRVEAGADPATLERTAAAAGAAVADFLDRVGPGDADKMFDLRTQSPLDLKIGYALAQGWLTPQAVEAARAVEAEAIVSFRNRSPEHKDLPFDDEVRARFVGPQIGQRLAGPRGELAEAAARGMFQEIQRRCPQRLDLETGELTLGDTRYRRGAKLGEGGLGVAYAYESDDGQRVVLKSLKAGGQTGHEGMQREVWNNRYLNDADDGRPGKNNVLKMLDAVLSADGTLHMVMEMGAADVNTPKMVMRLVSDAGMLPEPARALVNQYMLKQALEGVRFLRDEGMVHFDLKEENLMVMPDGTVKVLDFGGALVHEPGTDDLPAGAVPAQTPLYAPKDPYSTKHDTYAMGRAASAMQAGESVPRADDVGRHQQMTELIGAFGRFAEALLASADQRTTLDAALEADYLANLRGYREEDLSELLQAVVDYGRTTSGKKIAVYRERLAGLDQEIAALEARGDAGTTEHKFIEARTKRDEMRRELAQLEPNLEHPQAREKLERIRELSQKLLRPTADLEEQPHEPMRDFLVSLQSTLDSPPHFAKFISLPANRVFWRQLGVDSRALEAAADGRNLNFGGENGRQLWEKTFAAAQAAAASTRDAAIRQLLVRGLDQLLETYHKELAKDGSLAAGPAVVTIAAGLPPTDPSPVTQDDLLGPCRILINRHPLLTPQTNALCQGLLVLSPAESDCWLELTPGVAGSQACAALVDLRVGLLAQSVNRSLLALAEEVRGLLAQRANPPAGGPSDEDLLRGARTVVLQKCRQIEGWVRTFPGKLCDDLRKLGATNIVVQAMPHFLAPDDATVTLPLSISAASPTDRRERAETRFEAFQ